MTSAQHTRLKAVAAKQPRRAAAEGQRALGSRPRAAVNECRQVGQPQNMGVFERVMTVTV